MKGYSGFTFGGRNSVFVLRNVFFMSFLSQKRKKKVVWCGGFFFFHLICNGLYETVEMVPSWDFFFFLDPVVRIR